MSNQEKREEERKKQSAATKNKPYQSYNWEQLVTDGQLRKLKVVELDKYIIHNNLDRDILRKNKEEKVLFIIEHLTRNALSHCNSNREVVHTNSETLENNPDNYDVMTMMTKKNMLIVIVTVMLMRQKYWRN